MTFAMDHLGLESDPFAAAELRGVHDRARGTGGGSRRSHVADGSAPRARSPSRGPSRSPTDGPSPSPTEEPGADRPSRRTVPPQATAAGTPRAARRRLTGGRVKDEDRRERGVERKTAVIVVPRPGEDRTVRVPLASSTRSRIEASPTRPCRRNSRAFALSNPSPSSSTSTRKSSPSVSTWTCDRRGGLACLRGVRERLLHDAERERLEVVGDLLVHGSAERRRDAVLGAEPREGVAERRDQPALLQHRRAETRHQAPERRRPRRRAPPGSSSARRGPSRRRRP